MKLAEAVEIQITRKQSVGCRYHDEAYLLRIFSRQCGNVELREVTPAAVKLFIDNGRSANARRKRHYLLRLFYDYWVVRGEVPSSPLPVAIAKVPETFTPYVYTRAEIRKLLDATSLSQQQGWCVMSAATFRTLLLFLYGTGLRLGEALRLDCQDLDSGTAVLRVKQTKFYKSRLVPVGPELRQILAQHLSQKAENSSCRKLFQSESCEPIQVQNVSKSFQRLRQHAGIARHDFTTYQPRVHDLRHTFAVHRLVAWYQQGKDVQRLLPALSTYLGHVNMASTQRYLTMTPELLQQASERFERYAFGGQQHGR